MARRRRRKRKNPSRAQWIVLSVGGAVGLGLLGYGVYVLIKEPKAPGVLPEGAAAPGMTYEYMVLPGPGGTFMAQVFPPTGVPIPLSGFSNPAAATRAAITYIQGRAGIPVARPRA